MRLNDAGKIIHDVWKWLESQYTYIVLDEFVVMPNHLHGILHIRRGGSRTTPTPKTESITQHANPAIKPLGRLIGAFKTVSSKRLNSQVDSPNGQIWQRDYYDHIIRDENSLSQLRLYIENNPLKWALDPQNPANSIVSPNISKTESMPWNI
ncbi:MAG TPA: transposase [Candidatus Ozemobacteraceae bacterium]|nr:transposase [Candidatus Ozemobacteraceae bacterium]